MKNKISIVLSSLCLAIVFVVTFLSVKSALANIAGTTPAASPSYQNCNYFSTSTTAYAQSATVVGSLATTSANATSTNITPWNDSNGRLDNGYCPIAGARKVEVYFTKQGATTTPLSTTAFKVEVTPDGTNWYPFPKLVLSTTTTKTTVSAIYLTGSAAAPTTTVPVALDLTDDSFLGVRCIANTLSANNDGEVLCSATILY